MIVVPVAPIDVVALIFLAKHYTRAVMILEAKFEEKRIELRIVRDAAFPSLIC